MLLRKRYSKQDAMPYTKPIKVAQSVEQMVVKSAICEGAGYTASAFLKRDDLVDFLGTRLPEPAVDGILLSAESAL